KEVLEKIKDLEKLVTDQFIIDLHIIGNPLQLSFIDEIESSVNLKKKIIKDTVEEIIKKDKIQKGLSLKDKTKNFLRDKGIEWTPGYDKKFDTIMKKYKDEC